MKGVSAVIATILMLLITIALAGTAYLYITGVFTSRTAVALSIDGISSTCTAGGNLSIVVKNDGTTAASFTQAAVSTGTIITQPNGTAYTSLQTNCYAPSLSISAGSSNAGSPIQCTRLSTTGGSYTVSVSLAGSTASGTIYCVS